MVDSIADLASRLALTVDKKDTVVVDELLTTSFSERAGLGLVGKVLTTRPFNVEAMKSTLMTVWRPAKGMDFHVIGVNLFLFHFHHVADKRRVLLNGPWSFNKHLLLLNEVDAHLQPSEVLLSEATFWIQVHNLPLISMTKAVGYLIGNKIGSTVDVEYGADRMAFGRYMRIRVTLNVAKPLRRGMKLAVHNRESVWVVFKYERLPNFCYFCGVLGHSEKECNTLLSQAETGTANAMQYGPWLRADVQKPRPRPMSPVASRSQSRGKVGATGLSGPEPELHRAEGPGVAATSSILEGASLFGKAGQSASKQEQILAMIGEGRDYLPS
ncbi:Uncharacterized protein LOK49_LG08G03245 [Camellia lanceoleosa]|uniref:Uncharacterized protein n=1 Tax=Camellia lanceoleosa TaxID=1840588 RepID=A0ACC0GW19_9ERIC|nr:Uncharacterized protein LOK49_LG08G03245 [Camellia lanceoleosa]